MIESHHVLTAAAPGGLVSVGAGWPSPTAWAVAGIALGLLTLIARWASRRHRERTSDLTPGMVVSRRSQPTSPTQRGQSQPKQTREEQP